MSPYSVLMQAAALLGGQESGLGSTERASGLASVHDAQQLARLPVQVEVEVHAQHVGEGVQGGAPGKGGEGRGLGGCGRLDGHYCILRRGLGGNVRTQARAALCLLGAEGRGVRRVRRVGRKTTAGAAAQVQGR